MCSDTASLQISASNGISKQSLKGLGDYINPPLCSKPRPSKLLLFPAIPNISCLLSLEDLVLETSNSSAFSPHSWFLIKLNEQQVHFLSLLHFSILLKERKKPRRDTRFLNCPKMPLTNWLVFTDSQFHCRGHFFFSLQKKRPCQRNIYEPAQWGNGL